MYSTQQMENNMIASKRSLPNIRWIVGWKHTKDRGSSWLCTECEIVQVDARIWTNVWRRANLSIRPSESDTNFKHICTCDRLNYISCINIWVINAIQRSSAIRREYIIAKCVLYCVYCTLHIGPTSCPPV